MKNENHPVTGDTTPEQAQELLMSQLIKKGKNRNEVIKKVKK